ncbi:thioesterase-like superfamily-domain-containing protein [Xylogone sp. PMI_703]|nr:thioesterase-like superfamily-domain-containing protein [Xylogone sp. PMI_703]
MANSHLPNSHPDATPDWQDLDYTRTPFRQAITTELVEGAENCFSGFVPRDWCVPGDLGLVSLGGFCAALIISTSQKYSAKKFSEREQPAPIHMHIQYLEPLPHGPVNVLVHDIKSGTTHHVVEIELKQPNSLKSCVLSLVTLRRLSAVRHSIKTPPFPLPDRESECQRWTDSFFYNVNPTSSQFRTYVPKGGHSHMWSPAVGQNARDVWMKLDDEKDSLGLAHLGLIADLIPPIPLNYEKSGTKGIMKWAFPTICLSLDIWNDPTGEEWLLQRVIMNECKDGRFDMEVKIINEKGRLVATGQHTSLMVSRTSQKLARDGKKGAQL